jgi:hypothetical protein
MKTFLIFLAFAIVFSACLVYQSDVNNYMLLQKWLKATAEEAAAGGALMIDDRSYEEKRYIINFTDASRYVMFTAKHAKSNISPLKNGSIGIITWRLSDTQIKATVSWYAFNDYRLFRLPFIDSPDYLSAMSVYEVKQI